MATAERLSIKEFRTRMAKLGKPISRATVYNAMNAGKIEYEEAYGRRLIIWSKKTEDYTPALTQPKKRKKTK